MALVELQLPETRQPLPCDVASFLADVDARIDCFMRSHPTWGSGFVPSNFETVYHALQAISESNLTTGRHLCEWGSGFGVVAMLAEMVGFRSCGIEIDQDLVDEARDLAGEFALEAEFIHGSFIPRGSESCAEEAYADNDAGVVWLVTETDDAYEELGLEPDDFDIVFAYPWPGEEDVIDRLFDRCASDGALLLTYGQCNSVRLQRKRSKRLRSV
ncbi:MAG: class I SAM-dependent methyltransferase [Planctomycetaceae bacterium]|nr:class I SAM-dependent methyltransferase [Planctomycetales bacterium]MCB9921098.1 class I SAM-dependent methyltransferase [Planctomycetaceae bacterium]